MILTNPNDSILHELIQNGQTHLAWQYQKQKMITEYNHKKEMERMKQEIIAEVLSRIEISVDTKQAIIDIKELEEALKNFGNKGGF